MANGLETTLQSIRQGGPAVENTLAGQIGAIRQKRAAAKTEAAQNLRDFLLEQQEAASEARRRSVQSQTDLDEMRRKRAESLNKRLFGISRGLLTLSEQNPEVARAKLAQNPELARTLQVDPRSPEWQDQLRAVHDRYRAQVTGDIPGSEGEERSVYVRPGSDLGRQLGLDRPAEVQYKGTEGPVADLSSPDYNIIDFQYVGPQQEGGPTAYETGIAGARVEQYKEAAKNATDAPIRLARIQQMQSAIEGGAATGFAGEPRQVIAQGLELAGLEPEKVAPGILSSGASTEVVDAASNQLAIQFAERLSRPNKLALKMVKRAVPELAKTPEGNMVLLRILENMALRDQQIGTIANIFAGTPAGALTRPTTIPGVGEMPKGTTLSEATAAYDKQNPIINEELEAQIREAGTGPLTPPTDAGGNVRFSQMRKNETYRIKGEDYIFKGYSEEEGDYILEPEN